MIAPALAETGRSRLSDFSSTLDTEVQGVRLALIALHGQNGIIITDSLNTILDIQNTQAHHKGIGNIQETILARKKAGLTTAFIWIPSHVGIRGNEHADKAALEGALLPEITHPSAPSISRIKGAAARATQHLWDESITNERVRNPHSYSWVWHSRIRKAFPVPKNLPVTSLVAVTRFRTSYRRHIDIPTRQRCPCGSHIFSAAHALASCKALDHTPINQYRIQNAANGNNDFQVAEDILTKMAKAQDWEPLGRFLRKNEKILETVGPADPDSE